MEPNNELRLVLSTLSDTLKETSKRLNEVLTEQATMRSDLVHLKEEVQLNSEVLRHGRNGNPSLVTKVEVLINDIDDVQEMVEKAKSDISANKKEIEAENKEVRVAKWKVVAGIVTGILGILSAVVVAMLT